MKRLQILIISFLIISSWYISSCFSSRKIPSPQDALIAKGRNIFFNETFGGNGRTCGTCHRAENNLTIDPAFIATLPDTDRLFVAEFTPALKENFENPKLMRSFGLILENLDGFDDLKTKFVRRGVPHTFGLRNSVLSSVGPHTGWSGDGAPGDKSLRSFATGAVIQHFTKTLNRISGVDFRLPTEDELDALEAFQLSSGHQEDLKLPLKLKSIIGLRGQEIFNDPKKGKCLVCHFNAGANANPDFFGANAGNLNFNTGVEDLPDKPTDLSKEFTPRDDGFGTPGDATFNVPPLVEAAETGPFFHNNSVETIEGAVAFYDGESFNNSPAAKLLDSLTGSRIELDATEIVSIASFLRVINALENIRQGTEFLNSYVTGKYSGNEEFNKLPTRATDEADDATRVLSSGGLHPEAVFHLKKAIGYINYAMKKRSKQSSNFANALSELELARKEIIE
jgi:hypothetical protein